MRNEIERVVKENNIERSRCFECSKISYASIIKKIEQTFVLHGKNIHWSNMGHGFNPKWQCKTKNISKDMMWIDKLPYILPKGENEVYVLFEDTQNYKPKYWLYEMRILELCLIVKEVYGLNDYYIISKKFNWLISECHEDVVSFVGSSLDLSCFDE